LFLAAVLRLGWPGIIEFKRDEATLSRLALDLAKGDHFPILGIGSSVGFPNAPINVYLFTIPYVFGDNPILATLFVGFLNILAVALLWKMTRRYFGPVAAFLASLFYAVSPWAVIYSRKIWAQDILAPFIIATVFTGFLGFLELKPKRWAQLLHLLLLAITVQIHFGAVTLIPLTLLMLILGWRQIRREFWMGVGLAGLVSLPFIYGLYDADLLSLSAIHDSLDKSSPDGEETTRELSSTSLDYAWFTVAGTDIHSLTGENQFQRYLETVPSVYWLFKLIPIGTIILALALALLAYRKRYSPVLVITVLAWLILPIITFTYTWAEPTPHYMIPMMPVAYMLFAVGIVLLYHLLASIPSMVQYQRTLVYGIGILITLIVVFQSWLLIALLRFVDTHDTTGAFGTPLHYLLDIREVVLESNSKRVILADIGDSPAFDNDPAVWDILLDGAEDVNFIKADYLWVVTDGEASLLVTQQIDESHDWLSIANTPPTQEFSLRPNEGTYRLWSQIPFTGVESTAPINAQFANGVTLEAAWRQGSTIWLDWRLSNPQSDILYSVFVHAMNGEERVGQIDLPFWGQSNWHQDDHILMRLPLSVENAQNLRIGMYQIIGEDQYQNSEYVDEQGHYVDQWVTIPIAEIIERNSID
jgi:4-amino-4-deoxy-L-arabinose transferase-like glycosyltransferase